MTSFFAQLVGELSTAGFTATGRGPRTKQQMWLQIRFRDWEDALPRGERSHWDHQMVIRAFADEQYAAWEAAVAAQDPSLREPLEDYLSEALTDLWLHTRRPWLVGLVRLAFPESLTGNPAADSERAIAWWRTWHENHRNARTLPVNLES